MLNRYIAAPSPKILSILDVFTPVGLDDEIRYVKI